MTKNAHRNVTTAIGIATLAISFLQYQHQVEQTASRASESELQKTDKAAVLPLDPHARPGAGFTYTREADGTTYLHVEPQRVDPVPIILTIVCGLGLIVLLSQHPPK